MSNPTIAKGSDTYRRIATRLSGFNPPILIDQHIASDLFAGRTTLDGISFVARDYDRLLAALRNAKDLSGEKAFAEGSMHDPRHWALRLSFTATHGIGFREIWRPHLSDRPLSIADGRNGLYPPQWNSRFSANFGDSMQLPDLSSLHCGISKETCNIHIDEMGFVMTGPTGDIVVSPDFLRHTLVELLWKTKLNGKIPLWALDRFSFVIPSSPNNFSRAGLSFDVVQSKTYKLTLTGTCSILGGIECSGTLSFSGSHNLGSH
jgi:hypothetical protein